MGRSTEAAEVIGRAVALRPDHAGVLGVLSAVLASNGDYAGAEQAARRAVRLQSSDADAWVQLGNISIDVGEVDAAAEAYGRAVELAPGNRVAAHNRLYALHLSATIGDDELFDALRNWGAGQPYGNERPDRGRDPDRRLRIGYVSADFARHPVGWFMAPVLPNHDPAQVEVFCYSDREVEDDLTRFLRNHCQSWISTSGMDDRALADRIRADEIDLLIDLGGHTARNRLGTFALGAGAGAGDMGWIDRDDRVAGHGLADRRPSADSGGCGAALHRAHHPAASWLCVLRTAGLRAGRHAVAGSRTRVT